MRVTMPSLKDRAYIYRKLRASFKQGYTEEGLKLFRQAQNRFCIAMSLQIPKVEWCVELRIAPNDWTGNIEQWINTIYHEWGHYYLWAEAEEKADEFAAKMWNRAK